MRTGLTKQEKTTDIWFDEKDPLIHNRKRVSAVLRDRCFEAQADCSFARTGLFRSRDSHNS